MILKTKMTLSMVNDLNIKENIKQKSQNYHLGNDVKIKIISLGNIQLARKYSPGTQTY